MTQAPIIFREANDSEKRHWDELVMRFPNYQIFHLYGWVKSLEEYTQAKALFLVGEHNRKIVACCPGLIYRFTGLRFFCSPREGWQTDSMGPVFDPALVNTTDLISALMKYLRKTHRVKYIEMNSRSLDRGEMQKLGFVEEVMPTLRTPLSTTGPEEMFKMLDGKTRNHVRKAIKSKLTTKFGPTDEFIENFYTQIKGVFQRRKTTLPFSRKRIEIVFKYLGESDHLLPISILLSEESECIATGIFLLANHEVYLWGWAHRQDFGSFYPIELLTWTAIEIAIKKGFTVLDFGGLGKAKKKFSSIQDEDSSRYMIGFFPGLIALRSYARRVYRWQQNFRGILSSKINQKLGRDL